MPGRVDELAAAFANYAQVRGGNSGRQGRARPQEKLRLDVDATSLRRQPDLRADQARSNSPCRTPAVNACHSSEVKTSTGPSRSFESRTATTSRRFPATSTQAPPLALLRLLLHHLALVKSMADLSLYSGNQVQ